MSLWSRIVNVIRRDRVSRDIDEELQSHIAEAIEQGRDPNEARRVYRSIDQTSKSPKEDTIRSGSLDLGKNSNVQDVALDIIYRLYRLIRRPCICGKSIAPFRFRSAYMIHFEFSRRLCHMPCCLSQWQALWRLGVSGRTRRERI